MRPPSDSPAGGLSRRRFLRAAVIGGALGGAGLAAHRYFWGPLAAGVFIAGASSYELDLAKLISQGLDELGVTAAEVGGKRILLKPNLVEPHPQATHINTHPLVVGGAAEAFLRLGAERVIVAEGPGHRRDTLLVLEQSGLQQVLHQHRIPFFDLNEDAGYRVANAGRLTQLKTLAFSRVLAQVDWVVSMAKLKTHHWAGVTLSMKNLFGTIPGILYGWPKNVLHTEGIIESILDLTATLRPQFAIVDGIVGMEGDGPIMGPPRPAGVIVMGRNLPAVDATSARVMGIDPQRIFYLSGADEWLGPIRESRIQQRGETLESVRTNFALVDSIPAHQGIRLE